MDLTRWILIWVSLIHSGKVDTATLIVCITNCGQCKQMFGAYFLGELCAEACLASAGVVYPDCNNPSAIKGFLKRLAATQ